MNRHCRYLSTRIRALLLCGVLLVAHTVPSSTAASEELGEFLEVTGFDVALESLKLSADAAPQMVGVDEAAFGAQWSAAVNEVFDTAEIHDDAVDMLAQTLAPELRDHAIGFYGSDLGQSLVRAENGAHLEDDEALKQESGEAIIDGLVRLGTPRLGLLKRLAAASGSADASIHALQEVQVRFLMAAAAAGVIELQMDEADLRAVMAQQEGALRLRLQTSGLASAAYTYQAFSDAEVETYAKALEDPRMQRVYELMNAVQFQIMADRFEALARRMQDMRPSQEL